MAKEGKRRRPSRRTVRRRWLAGIVVGVIVAFVAVAYLGFGGVGNLYAALVASATPPGTATADQGNRHIAAAETPHEPYNSDPPTSGPHLSYIAPWGVHTRPIPPELQVHNLEDGGVLVQYSCECPELVARLRAIVQKYDKFVILAPYPTMKSRIALTAWTRIDRLEELDEKRIARFIEAYRGTDHHR
jgi:hypothetical protein